MAACQDADLAISERQSVEIDYSAKCGGVWLDRGELDKIIEPSERYEWGRHDREHPPEATGGYYEKPQRRKPFWNELFD